jgi:hypothetical protein
MALGDGDRDELAYELAQTDFDAVERDGLRAEWSADNTAVTVVALDSGEETVYNGEDLVRAASDTEVRNARNPTRSEE